eukprot:4983609-Alexandrium_andersonii.AAC.1
MAAEDIATTPSTTLGPRQAAAAPTASHKPKRDTPHTDAHAVAVRPCGDPARPRGSAPQRTSSDRPRRTTAAT